MAVYETHGVESELVPSPIAFSTLHPNGDTAGLPVLVFLHGGDGDESFLADLQPVFEHAWESGALPPALVVTPAAQHSFYLDYARRDEQWETFLLDEFIPHVRSTFGASDVTAVSGISMGGMGSLRVAFRRPDLFVAVAALEPAIEASADWSEITSRDRIYRPMDLLHALYGDPIDADHFRRNHPLHLADENAAAIAASELQIYFECGDEDMLHLYFGAEVLHRQLFDVGIKHEYRLVRGANHLGRSLGPRVLDALRFVGDALQEAPPDTDPRFALMRDAIPALEVASGYRRSVTVTASCGAIEATLLGEGRPVLLTGASLVLDEVAARLAAHGLLAIIADISAAAEAADVAAVAAAAAIDDGIAVVRLDASATNAALYTTAILKSLV